MMEGEAFKIALLSEEVKEGEVRRRQAALLLDGPCGMDAGGQRARWTRAGKRQLWG